MQFLDNIILGYNTPRFADEAQFPSKTYKKIVCNRKHCDTACAARPFAEFEFWAYVLSEKKVEKTNIRKNIHTMNRDLRFSVWIKCCGCKDRSIKLEPASYGRSQLSIHDENDESIVKFILDMYKDVNAGSQKEIFDIFKNLERCFPRISNRRLLISFIRYALELPSAEPLMVFRFIHVLIKSYNFHGVFCHSIDESTSGNNGDSSEFWRILVCEHPFILDQVVDILICYENADVTVIPGVIKEQVGNDDAKDLVEFLRTKQGLEYLDTVFESKKTSKVIECEDKRETTYFDFLVVQNELVKAQEGMRTELSEKVHKLERERDELYIQKVNLMNMCKSLGAELRKSQEDHINELERILRDSKNKCKTYGGESNEFKQKT